MQAGGYLPIPGGKGGTAGVRNETGQLRIPCEIRAKQGAREGWIRGGAGRMVQGCDRSRDRIDQGTE